MQIKRSLFYNLCFTFNSVLNICIYVHIQITGNIKILMIFKHYH